MADIELQAEETVLKRLEKLGEGQGRIFDKISRDRRIAAAVAFLALIAAVLFANAYFNQRDTIDENRAAICTTAEAFTNALIASGPAPVDEDARARQQTRIDAFEADLERRLDQIGCDLHLTVVAVP